VLNVARRTLEFMSPRERVTFFIFLSLRAIVALLDLIGILAIGFLATSVALFISQGSDPSRVIEVGSITVPAVTMQNLPLIAAMVLLLFSAKAVLSILLTRQLAYFLSRIEARAARAIAQNAFGKGLEGASANSREEILYAVQTGSPSAFNNVMNSIGTLTAEGFLFALVLAAFTIVNPAVALGAVLYFGIIGFLIQFFLGRVMHRTGLKVTESTVEANSVLSDLGEVLRESTILGRQKFFFDRIFHSRLRTSGSAATQFVLTGMPRYIVETSLIIAIAVFIILQASSGEIASSAATIGIFLTGGLRLTSSLLPLQGALLSIKQAVPPASRALDFLTPTHESSIQLEVYERAEMTGEPLSVSSKNLSFGYKSSESDTLTGISFEIKEGSQAAFIGVSGAGKSTLADLILGLLVPTSGEILVNGVNPTDLLERHPGLLGYVPQKPGMVSGTISQNIALGVDTSDVDEQKLSDAISDAHLTELIAALPQGLNTDIGKRKDGLSGGQLQRIGLARALYSKPKLLVMDEATSALDAESENEINKALDAMRGKVTVILIAHRLNTIQRSDIVFLMEAGKISASGTFQDLLKENEKVKHLAQLMAIDSDQKLQNNK
jgi:ABC-type bacteriocin/lantibiotic exporter with double-glycine peptidase domain